MDLRDEYDHITARRLWILLDGLPTDSAFKTQWRAAYEAERAATPHLPRHAGTNVISIDEMARRAAGMKK